MIITGPTGSGKSFLACARADKACKLEFKARYVKVAELARELVVARQDGSYPRLMARLAKTHLLVIDEWLRDPLSQEHARELLDLIDDRFRKLLHGLPLAAGGQGLASAHQRPNPRGRHPRSRCPRLPSHRGQLPRVHAQSTPPGLSRGGGDASRHLAGGRSPRDYQVSRRPPADRTWRMESSNKAARRRLCTALPRFPQLFGLPPRAPPSTLDPLTRTPAHGYALSDYYCLGKEGDASSLRSDQQEEKFD